MGGSATWRSIHSRLTAVVIPFAVLASALLFDACGPLDRPYYNRDVGGYLQPDPSMSPTTQVPAELGSADGSLDDRLRRVAESYLGVPYRFGGQSRSGMDCSGFIRQVFEEVHGLRLPHNSASIYRMGKPVSKADLKPGDLVFFRNLGFIDHGGIYMGQNFFIHAASSVGVAYSALNAPYFGEHYAGARRLAIPGAAPSADEP